MGVQDFKTTKYYAHSRWMYHVLMGSSQDYFQEDTYFGEISRWKGKVQIICDVNILQQRVTYIQYKMIFNKGTGVYNTVLCNIYDILCIYQYPRPMCSWYKESWWKHIIIWFWCSELYEDWTYGNLLVILKHCRLK